MGPDCIVASLQFPGGTSAVDQIEIGVGVVEPAGKGAESYRPKVIPAEYRFLTALAFHFFLLRLQDTSSVILTVASR